jgi:hypothetical protein
MLAELVDAVVGVDTHRDTHEAEIAHPTGMPIATCQVSNDSTGYAELLAWIVDHAPGPRLVVSIEGTRSYGLPLARAVTSAGRSWSSASNRTAILAGLARRRGPRDASREHAVRQAEIRRIALAVRDCGCQKLCTPHATC